MTDETTAPQPWRGRRRGPVAYSHRLARAIASRVADGESLISICESAGMPHENTVGVWLKRHPRFATLVEAARTAAGPRARAAQLSSFCQATADLVLERMIEGETLTGICRDPAMPSFSTVYRWTRTFPDFASDFRAARQGQAERLADEGLEVAAAVTAPSAHATAVRLTQMRWAAGVFAPRRFGRFRPVEADAPQEVTHYLFRHFRIEEHPETGECRVVSYMPDPETNQPVLHTQGPWRRVPYFPDLSPGEQASREADMTRMKAYGKD